MHNRVCLPRMRSAVDCKVSWRFLPRGGRKACPPGVLYQHSCSMPWPKSVVQDKGWHDCMQTWQQNDDWCVLWKVLGQRQVLKVQRDAAAVRHGHDAPLVGVQNRPLAEAGAEDGLHMPACQRPPCESNRGRCWQILGCDCHFKSDQMLQRSKIYMLCLLCRFREACDAARSKEDSECMHACMPDYLVQEHRMPVWPAQGDRCFIGVALACFVMHLH